MLGMIIPAKKAPKSAWIPINSVHNADRSTTPTTTARTILSGSGRSRANFPSQRGRFGLRTNSMSATKSNTTPRLKVAPPTLVACAIATTNASMLHAVTSSTAAQAVAVLPSEDLNRPRSRKMRTSTGKAVILIEMPMNSAKAVKVAPGCAR